MLQRLGTRTRVVLAALALLTAIGVGHAINAADHADSPATTEGNLDINDLYVFNQGQNVVFIMTVSPLLAPGQTTADARLNPNGLYEFSLDSQRDGIADAVIRVGVSGTGDAQTIRVRGPAAPRANGNIPGPPVDAAFNTVGENEGVKAWVGPSDDPFYIDLFGDKSLTSVLNAAFGLGEPNTLMFKEVGVDDLAGLNVLSIVVEVPKSRIAEALGIDEDGTFFAWATTSELQ